MMGEGGRGKGSMVVIIGGGLMGLCVAEACLLAGREVLVLEREERGWSGASSGGSGLVLPARRGRWGLRARGLSGAGRWARLNRAAVQRGWGDAVRDAVRELAAEGQVRYRSWCEEGGAGEIGLREQGALVVYGAAGGLEAERALAGEDGEEFEVVGEGELRAGGLTSGVGALRYRRAWQLDPAGLIDWLGRRVSVLGGHIEYGAEVKKVLCRGRRARGIETADGREYELGELVVAAGAWSGRVLRGMGVRLPLGIGTSYGASWDRGAGGEVVGEAMVLADVGLEVVPMGGRLRVVSLPEWGSLGRRGGGEGDRLRCERMVGEAARWLGVERVEAGGRGPIWARREAQSPDGLPYVGRVRPLDNVSVAAGHGGLGIPLAPATGRLVAAQLGVPADWGDGRRRGQGSFFEPRRFG